MRERKAAAIRLQKNNSMLQEAHQLLTQRQLNDNAALTTQSTDEGVLLEQQQMESIDAEAIELDVIDGSSTSNESADESAGHSLVTPDLSDQLRMWANRNRISQTATDQLLKILHHDHPELSCHQRTLLRTSIDICLENVAGGEYSYLSLKRVLPNVLKKAGLTLQNLTESNNQLKIQFNIDRLPVFNSVNYSVWPILGSVVSPIKSDVFAIAVFGGNSKPNDFNAYIKPLVNELQQIANDDGFFLTDLGLKVQIMVENFCCDAPAKADLRLVKQFNARQGCERCNVSGTYIQHRMVLETGMQETRLRHDDDFDIPLQDDKDDRAYDEYRKQDSILHSDLRLGMISQFPYDYMHLVCLNVVRNMAGDWNRAEPCLHS